nr:MAG TPA: hypothetical protein [Herelleviridae sp.]
MGKSSRIAMLLKIESCRGQESEHKTKILAKNNA